MSKITIWGTRSAAVRGGSGITYYVSASGGDDLNDGLSELTPWQTTNKVNAMAAPGTTILFKRGDTWSPDQFGPTMESLHPETNGSIFAPIIFGTYGSGNLPVIDGAVSIAPGGWTKTGGYTNIYQTPLSGWEMDDLYKEAEDGGDRGPAWEVTPAGTQGKCIFQADRSQADVLVWLDANPGYNYYDLTNDVLYLHTPDSTSPITNGRTYRPSVFKEIALKMIKFGLGWDLVGFVGRSRD